MGKLVCSLWPITFESDIRGFLYLVSSVNRRPSLGVRDAVAEVVNALDVGRGARWEDVPRMG